MINFFLGISLEIQRGGSATDCQVPCSCATSLALGETFEGNLITVRSEWMSVLPSRLQVMLSGDGPVAVRDLRITCALRMKGANQGV